MPATTTSSPQASVSSGAPANEHTASTITTAPCRWAAAATSRTGFMTPVEVSAWTTRTAAAGVASRLRATSSGSTGSPQGARTTVDLGARAAGDLLEEEAEAAVLDDDDPLARARRGSRPPPPCRRGWSRAPGTSSDSASGRRCRRRSCVSAMSAVNAGSNCPTSPVAIARRTRGSGFVGPEPMSSRAGSARSADILRDAARPSGRGHVGPREIPAVLEEEPRALLDHGHQGHGGHHAEEPERLLPDEDRHHAPAWGACGRCRRS